MNKKLQVFVSSTYTDLIEERQAAVQAILDAGHIPAGMELFKAGKSQMKTIRKWIDESDVYMLILGGRYGSIEEESGLSYTELEYRYALSKNMPVFAIVLAESFLCTKAASHDKNTIFEKENIEKNNAFKELVKSTIVKFVNNINQIPTVIHAQLNDIFNDSEYSLIGWVRANQCLENESKDYSFEQLTRLLDNKTFTSYNILKQSYCKSKSITATKYFIVNYDYLCSPYKYEDTPKFFASIYDEVIPFFVRLGLMNEEKDNTNPKYGKAYLTPTGLKLYTKLTE